MAAASGNGGNRASGPRCIALVGPFQSGKTTLLEAILSRTGAIARQGTVEAGTTVGDSSREARHHKMSVELTVATTQFMGDNYTFLDCPGSVEFAHDMRAVLPAVDAAVVVCEADEKKMPQLQLIMRELEALDIPRFLFLNKIDKAEAKVMEALQILQPASRKPLVMRQLPTFNNGIVNGFVDLALERVHIYKEHAESQVVPLEGENLDRSKDARFSMLEKLADHDDELMEQLLADIPPPRDKVFDDLAKEVRDGDVCPVLLGCATRTNGVLRLMKALRHESPNVQTTAMRLGVQPAEAVAYVLKTLNTSHAGKMSVVRVLEGRILDVVVDIRRGSPTYGKTYAAELSSDNFRQLYIPKGFAHGFSVLSEVAVVMYKCDKLYHRESEGGIAYNDPALAIDWKIPEGLALVSEKDLHQPMLKDCHADFKF